MKKRVSKFKICSRGHKYKGSGPCPICYPGHYKKHPKKR